MYPFFSIIIPTYNRASLLPKPIESVIEQTFKDWELIIVDDGSTDNTAEVVKPYLADTRICYICQANQERSVARNNGINRSRGIYITFLDSDDYFLPLRLELLHRAIVERGEPEAFLYTGICFERNGIIQERTELFNNYENVYDFILNAVIGVPQACIHKCILAKHQFDPQFTIGEDQELWLRIAQDSQPQILNNQATYIAIDHDDRSVNEKKNNPGKKQLELQKYIFRKHHPGYLASRQIKRKKLSDTYFSIARHYMYNGKRCSAITNLLFSIWIQPCHAQTKHRMYVLGCLITGKMTEYK